MKAKKMPGMSMTMGKKGAKPGVWFQMPMPGMNMSMPRPRKSLGRGKKK